MKTKINKKERNKILKIKTTTKNKRIHNRAMVLLLSNKGKYAAEIARLDILSEKGVKNIIRRYDQGGVDFALFDRKRSGRPPTVTPSDKQRIAAKACARPPEGRSRWTVALLTEEVKKDRKLPKTSRESVRQALHLHQIKPWLEKMWCVPTLNDEYIHRMEDVLDLYERPLNSKRPVVCLDEKPTQLLNDGRPTISAKLGSGIKKKDYEYKRKGTANIFCAVEPKKGQYFTKVD
jgi:transposase